MRSTFAHVKSVHVFSAISLNFRFSQHSSTFEPRQLHNKGDAFGWRISKQSRRSHRKATTSETRRHSWGSLTQFRVHEAQRPNLCWGAFHFVLNCFNLRCCQSSVQSAINFWHNNFSIHLALACRLCQFFWEGTFAQNNCYFLC